MVPVADFILASNPRELASPPGLVILSIYESPAVSPLSPSGMEAARPPARIGTSKPVPFIPFNVGLDKPNKEIDSPNPSAELTTARIWPCCLPNSSL